MQSAQTPTHFDLERHTTFGSMQLNRQRMRLARLDSSDQELHRRRHWQFKVLAHQASLRTSMVTALSTDRISRHFSATGAEPARATSTAMERSAGQTLLQCLRRGQDDRLLERDFSSFNLIIPDRNFQIEIYRFILLFWIGFAPTALSCGIILVFGVGVLIFF